MLTRYFKGGLPVLAILIAVGLWGPSFVATKMVLREIPPFTIALLRFLIASCFLYPMWWFSKERVPLSKGSHRDFFLGGMVGVTFYFALENLGLQITTAGNAALLTAAIPIICIMIETIWLRQSIPLQRSLGIVLSILGVYLVIGQAPSIGSGGRIAGDLLILAAALCWAIYSILGRNLNQYSKLTVVTYQTIYGTLMLFPFAASEYSQWHGLSLATCLNILYLGLMCSAATYLLYNYALKTLTASQVSTYLNLIPLIGVVTAMFLLGESIQFIQILGGGVILAGVAISTPT